ncbi:hypothetical protein TNCV_2095801 [Trichonephila clavipes]|nr:hypothetical protein TNCV_2095801 [Trichonephila clavipes]
MAKGRGRNLITLLSELPHHPNRRTLNLDRARTEDGCEFKNHIIKLLYILIPHSALKIYADGSMDDGGASGNIVHIETPDGTFDIKIRNINYCSVFRSELAV